MYTAGTQSDGKISAEKQADRKQIRKELSALNIHYPVSKYIVSNKLKHGRSKLKH